MEFDSTEKYAPITQSSLAKTPQWKRMEDDLREAVSVVSRVLPFRTNKYVLDHLIDWDTVPDDPIYRLVFPHQDMLRTDEYCKLRDSLKRSATKAEIDAIVSHIRARMNPHPAGQMTHNVPYLDGVPMPGLQHKYRETVLFFPSAGQTCHAYCTFCFRWPQFIGDTELRFDAKSSDGLIRYLKKHREVSDVLITGGDPLVMNTASLHNYITPLLQPDLSHIRNIRIGTKSVSYWPHRFVSDKDSGDLLKLFELVVRSGRNLALMAHYNHPRELSTPIARQALRNIVASGATVRVQAPVIRHINDDPKNWIDLWNASVTLGAVPYYMFVERDTGPKEYFHLPLIKAYEIFRDAYKGVSGLGRTVRGPSMSTLNGKVLIDGVVELHGQKAFALQFLQARQPEWVRIPFFAKYDPAATWFDQLEPLSSSDAKYFEHRNEAKAVVIHRERERQWA